MNFPRSFIQFLVETCNWDKSTQNNEDPKTEHWANGSCTVIAEHILIPSSFIYLLYVLCATVTDKCVAQQNNK